MCLRYLYVFMELKVLHVLCFYHKQRHRKFIRFRDQNCINKYIYLCIKYIPIYTYRHPSQPLGLVIFRPCNYLR